MVEIRSVDTGEVLHVVKAPTLRNVKLYRRDLHRADLHGADMRDAVLTDVDLTAADLRNADLRGSKWNARIFRQRRLRGAAMGGADLRGARLAGWSVATVLKYFVFALAMILGYYAVSWYLWPAHRSDHTFGSAVWMAMTVTAVSYLMNGMPYHLNHLDFSGAIWDDSTRWPSGFRPPAPMRHRAGISGQ